MNNITEAKKMNLKNKKIFLTLITAALISTATLYYLGYFNNIKQLKEEDINPAETNNPASIYCKENNGTIEFISDIEGVKRICVFPDGTRCEEWEYFRGECRKPEKKEALLGEEFRLRINDTATIKPIKLEVKLLSIAEETGLIKARITANSSEYEATYNPNKRDTVTEIGGMRIIKITDARKDKSGYEISFTVSKKYREIDDSCTTNSDCAIKDVGSLCGRFPACVNKNYEPSPPEINSSICNFTEINGCICTENHCTETINGQINEY